MLTELRNSCHRLLLRRLYPLLCRWQRLSGRRARVALVAVWHRGRLLVVRHSYRPGISLPGGVSGRHETSLEAALRELKEEVGIAAEPEALIKVGPPDGRWAIFEYHPKREPSVTIDNREIVAAAFVDPALITDPTQSLARYLWRARSLRRTSSRRVPVSSDGAALPTPGVCRTQPKGL